MCDVIKINISPLDMIVIPRSLIPDLWQSFKNLDTNIEFQESGFPIQTTAYAIIVHIVQFCIIYFAFLSIAGTLINIKQRFLKPAVIEKYGNKIDDANYFILRIGVLVLPARYLNDSIFYFLINLFAEMNFLTLKFEQ